MRIGDTITDQQADSLIDQITGRNNIPQTSDEIPEVTVRGQRDYLYWVLGALVVGLMVSRGKRSRRRRRAR